MKASIPKLSNGTYKSKCKRLFRKCRICKKRNQRFHKSSGWLSGYNSSCNKCREKWRAKHPKYRAEVARNRDRSKARARKFVYDYLCSHPCVDCGETDVLVLTLDHVRGRKYMHVSRMIINGCGVAKIAKELAKCQSRCASCHFRKTAKQLGYWKAAKQFGA